MAFFDRDDAHHRTAVSWLRRARKPLVTNIAVITEVTHLLDFSVEAQIAFLTWASRNLEIDTGTISDFSRIVEIMAKYRDRPADFADASLLALAERAKITRVASADADFQIYRTSSGRMLRNVFFAGV